MFYTAAGSLRQLRNQAGRIRALAQLPEPRLQRTSAVSGWTPAEHLDHLIRVAASILSIVLADDATPLSRGINGMGRVILGVGRIPRGRAAAPDRFRAERTTSTALLAALDAYERSLDGIPIGELSRRRIPIVKHPRLGGLTPGQALRFMMIHNDHHLRIIDDILKAPA